MADRNFSSKRYYYGYGKTRKTGWTKLLIFAGGLGIGLAVFLAAYLTSEYFSTDASCALCHVHPHVHTSWKLSSHVNNGSGVSVHCIDCHLPPRDDTRAHYAAKIRFGVGHLWSYLVKDSAAFDWEAKGELEHAVTYIPNASCKDCHRNLFPQGVSADAVIAHLYYEENEYKLNLQCISCHLDAGHYDPGYTHGKMTGIPSRPVASSDSLSSFLEPAQVEAFADFTEQIPGTNVSIRMKAIPGGAFLMGSPEREQYRRPDEGPLRTVTLAPFFLAEVETTWEQFWAFYAQTMSEGRTPPEVVYAANADPATDAISGPTPPFGLPDQGWGGGERPAITMTHYAAKTFCQWLSLKTGKPYRLPTEAEWEYAARAGTQTPYFFEGTPRSFSNLGFWRKFLNAGTQGISDYVIYVNNSKNRTREPEDVLPNPFGLKNMLGNVLEYCADKYDPQAYARTSPEVTDPLVNDGEEWVVRGGNYASDASEVRAAARSHTRHEQWMKTDPQQPKSIWWYSDVKGIGFRVACDASFLTSQ
ncbi:MAG: SUMF1/EgtB/PvdO family nonheme iron enzyme [Tannerellaceae bacterium]|jgi:formylglycine-generating enzyme required for sulfatase activity/nitrate/TMAO reductase-like tetraheme cytochrome c subunit|nr:SUMF1/EgtB/PvdO family nonheme iron enzyme [Tannerellaceae bacterium]